MLALAQTEAAKAGANYRIGRILAAPTYQTTLLTDGPETLTLRVKLVSSQRDMLQDGLYREQTVAFADRDQWVAWEHQRAWTSELPPVEAQQRLSRVRIAPRDVYRMTWQAVQRELSASIRLSSASMTLYTNALPQARFGIESAWVVSYDDDTGSLTYWIDAQTGTIVQQIRERGHRP